jgi:two-component system nitrate/nitrite response regulator NarL
MPTTLTTPERGTRTHPAPAVTGDCRVVVADDHLPYREGIVRALAAHGGFEVVAEAADGDEALHLIRELQPDLALLDVRMPGLDGVDIVHALAMHGPDVPVVMLSAFTELQLVESALEAGAAGYLDKGEEREVLCERLAAIASRRVDLSPRRLSPRDLIGRNGQWLPRLTGGEHQLLELAGSGLGKREIARRLGVAESVVRARAASVSGKLDCDSLGDAVREARAAGIIR